MKDICIFGASITWGAWDLESGGWVHRLRLKIDSGEEDSFIFNLSVPGSTTSDLIERFDTEVEARDPQVIIFSIGGVDSMHEGKEGSPVTSLDKFKKNIEHLVKKAQEVTDEVAVVGLTDIDELQTKRGHFEDDVFYTLDNVRKYSDAMGEVATTLSADFIDMKDLLDEEDLTDGLHPNSSGHNKIYNRVYNFLLDNGYLNG